MIALHGKLCECADCRIESLEGQVERTLAALEIIVETQGAMLERIEAIETVIRAFTNRNRAGRFQ